jgi:hypothetical protein
LKPTLLADWNLSNVLAQLNQVKQVSSGASATQSHSKSIFKENPDPANINEYHLGISEDTEPAHLEFKCGEFVVSNEGTRLRTSKDAPSVTLPEQCWCSSEAAIAAIKKVARQELEERLKKDRSKPEESKSLSLQISGKAAKKKESLAAGTMTLGTQTHLQRF